MFVLMEEIKISHGKTTNVVQRLGPDQSSRHIDSERLVTKRLNSEISQVFTDFQIKRINQELRRAGWL